MPAGDGRRIREGKLIRSGHLEELSESDRVKLSDLVDVVVDFRTNTERRRQPDAEIPGVDYHHIPIVESLTPGITHEGEDDVSIIKHLLFKPREAREYMCRMYSDLAASDAALAGYARFFRILLQPHKKAVLWHCTAGKDRAGIGSVLVQECLGVPREEILADYLATREFLAEDICFLTEIIKKTAGTDSPLADESLHYFLSAEEEYIEAFYASIEKHYGSMENCLRKGLGLTSADREHLMGIYLN